MSAAFFAFFAFLFFPAVLLGILFHGRPAGAAFAAAEDGQFIDMIFMQFLFVIHLDDNAGGLTEDVDALDEAVEAVRGLDFVAGMGKCLVELLIGLRLVFEAAHEPAAHARDLARVEGQVLLLGHLDGDGHEVGQPGVAAQGPAAAAVAAEDLGLVADAHLAQLDAGAEDACQVLDQLAEVHASVRREIKEYLAVVKGIFGVDELHVQVAAADPLTADPEGLTLFFAVSLLALVVLLRADAQDRLEGLRDRLCIDLHGGADYEAVFHAAGSLHDDMPAAGQLELTRVEIIDFSCRPEADADNFDLAVLGLFHRYIDPYILILMF